MKKWYLSKTLYVNVLGLVAIITQAITGQEFLNLEAQAGLLAVVNVILRLITKEELTA